MEPTEYSGGERSAADPLVCTATIVAALLRMPSGATDDGVSAMRRRTRAVTSGGPLVVPKFEFHGPNTAIVVLGHGVPPGGAMCRDSISRLRTGYVQALLAPASPIVVAGGHPARGSVEAAAMACWLIAVGMVAERVHVAPPDVDNDDGAARSSARLLRAIGIREAVVISSADHIERAAEVLAATGIEVVGTVTPDQVPALAWNTI